MAKKPDYSAYVVESAKDDGDKGFWTKIGSVWSHEDSDGFTVRLNALPVNGEIVIRKNKPKAETDSGNL